MTRINSAYESTPCKDYVLTKTKNNLLDAYVRSSLLKVRDNVYVVAPEEFDPSLSAIPVFNYPMVLEHNHQKFVVFDGRTMLARQNTGNLRPRRLDEFQAKIIQAQLALEWAEGYSDRIFGFNQMPMAVFSSWIGEVVAKRFFVNAQTQLQVSIAAAIYYYGLFEDSAVTNSNSAEVLVTISRACGWRAGDIEPILKAYPNIASLEEFCNVCRDYTQDVHLRDLNTLTLQGVVGGYWYGNAGREAIAIALEYPPIWLTLLFQAITDRSFKKAPLTGIVERNTYRRHHENFMRGLLTRSEYTGDDRIAVY